MCQRFYFFLSKKSVLIKYTVTSERVGVIKQSDAGQCALGSSLPRCPGRRWSKEHEEVPAPGSGDAGVGAELGNPAPLDASQDHELSSTPQQSSPGQLAGNAGGSCSLFVLGKIFLAALHGGDPSCSTGG